MQQMLNNYHIWRLINNQQMVVLILNVQRNVLRFSPQGLQLRYCTFDLISCSNRIRNLVPEIQRLTPTYQMQNAKSRIWKLHTNLIEAIQLTRSKSQMLSSWLNRFTREEESRAIQLTLSMILSFTATRPQRMLDWTRALLIPRILEEIHESNLDLLGGGKSTASSNWTPS